MDAYGISTLMFQSVTYLCQSAYIVGHFPSNWVIQTYGTQIPICLSVALTTTGVWIKTLIGQTFYYVIGAEFLIGVGMLLQLNTIVNLSNDWYSPSERIFMTSLACFFSFGGLAVGFVLPNL